MKRIGLLAIVFVLIGCGGAVIEPGHRGLVFDPQKGGLQHEVLEPGSHSLSMSARMEDFDVTYSSRTEALKVLTVEAISADVKVSIVFRPIIAELYQLDTEVGPKYYDEVVGPEFRSASRAAFARHSLTELPDGAGKLEDEVEADLRKRIAGKHIEIASVTFESVQLPPEVVTAIRDRQIAENEAKRKKIELESQAERDKLAADAAWEKEKVELQRNVERHKLQREAEGR